MNKSYFRLIDHEGAIIRGCETSKTQFAIVNLFRLQNTVHSNRTIDICSIYSTIDNTRYQSSNKIYFIFLKENYFVISYFSYYLFYYLLLLFYHYFINSIFYLCIVCRKLDHRGYVTGTLRKQLLSPNNSSIYSLVNS